MLCAPSRARMTKPPPGCSSGGGFVVLGGSVLEGVLDLLAGLLDVGLGLVALAFGLESLVAGGLTRGLLGVAAQLLSSVLDLVVESHDVPFRGPFRNRRSHRCGGGSTPAAPHPMTCSGAARALASRDQRLIGIAFGSGMTRRPCGRCVPS